MAFSRRGGYVITTLERNLVQASDVSQKTLHDVARYLGVTDLKPDETIRTIFYVTPATPAKE